MRLTIVAISMLSVWMAACGGGSSKSVVTPAPATQPVEVGATPGSETAAASPQAVASTAAPAGPATFSVLSGHMEGAMDIEMFMPAEIRVREGDTIEWTSKGYEGHTITFGTPARINDVLHNYLVPDPDDPAQTMFNPDIALATQTGSTFDGTPTLVSSGFIGVPDEAKYKLTFTKQGLYEYLCLVHPFTMRGTVSVEAPSAAVDSPASVTARGATDLAHYVDVEKRALKEATDAPRVFPGPAGSSLYRIAVGLTTPYGQVATYVKPVIDIKVGDTVIFANDDRDFHNVIFKGSKELPPGIGIKVDPGGRGLNFVLSKESALATEPSPSGFDDKTFLASGSMGVLQLRLTWTLKFDKPGTYVYNCTIHVLAGMAGVINVR
jgi:plastocyanin